MRSEDIARLAGVSRSTVSRVMNNYPNVPEETRRKVMKVIEKYRYEPNTSARVLAGKGTNTIGLFVVSIADHQSSNRIYQNNYFAPFVDAIVDTANSLGYYVLIHTVYTQEDFAKVRQAFLQRRIDGGIIVGTQTNIAMVQEIAGLHAPFILIDYDVAEIVENRLNQNCLSIINTDDYEGAKEAVTHLIDLGHREIAMITGRTNTYSGRQRYQAYVDTLHARGLPFKEAYVLHGEFLKHKAYEEVKRLIQSGARPTAIFSANDDMAIAAMKALQEEGLQVPDDVSIIGFDDVPVAAQLAPRLTSVRLPLYEMSKEAVHTVIAMCERRQIAFHTVRFPTKLMIRDSCKPL
ncbi:LacI family transcriptional regulator [Xylanibacillus composti]|uniref:LacI family transcriptional regulator n=1 Tax=Xylanibacillus composti TaxID=1572762 RepID=A0A8J4H2G4_9BACL|nr:LacI family DNA-binding transcriptional regulator [Xylanibacillus composti]MDT9725778.1 LacI family transcriptional regulator [Xylanibacillus composti]GIQ67508.1 LacI family transcriptional regulator [Xylanibacillus composti]